jgi:Rieske Fe-S protein
MSVKLKRLEQTAEQKKLELERKESNFILIAALSDLTESEGKYFTDFDMQPALAFAGKDGYPILISAKCTHLGCTVGNTLNAEGKILCPCHVSFFDIYTGMPNPDSPAKAPLPHVNWAVMDRKGKIIAAANKVGKVSGKLNLLSSMRSELNLYVSKEEVEVG